MKDANGNIILEGYCIELIERLSELMDFDYDLVIPQDNSPGMKLPSGEWTGLVGDLAKGVGVFRTFGFLWTFLLSTNDLYSLFSWQTFIINFLAPFFTSSLTLQETDIIVGALTMTSEREEAIDFVAPYFEQSGILISIITIWHSIFKFILFISNKTWLRLEYCLFDDEWSHKKTSAKDVSVQVHDSFETGSVAEYRRGFNCHGVHDLDTWQILSIQCEKQQRALPLSVQVRR